MADENLNLGRVGVIGRFRPLHLGATVMLESLCEQSEHVIIGIGSTNKYNLRNPFTPQEVEDMLHLVLSPKYNNYEIVRIPDFAHEDGFADGQRWVQEVRNMYQNLDAFVSGNPWTEKLLQPHYQIIHPAELIPKENWVYCKGSIVRMAMAKNEDWERLVRPEVATYMKERKLDERFKREFGLETIATLAGNIDYEKPEDLDAEYKHTRENDKRLI